MKKEAIYEVLPWMLWNQEIPDFAQLDYLSLHNELQIQTILGMSQNVLKKLPAEEAALRQQWREEVVQLLSHYDQYLFWQNEVLGILRNASIPCFVLKGSAAAQYYPHPEYRTMGDIDLFLHQNDRSKAIRLLQKCGFEEELEDVNLKKHAVLKRGRIVVELHTLYMVKTPDNILNQLMKKGLDHIQLITVSGYQIPVLPDLENGLILLQHIRQHLDSGLGLRQIIDWMYYVDAVLDDNIWYTQFQPLAQQLHLEELAVTVTKMCEKYLGLLPKGKAWYVGGSLETCDTLFAFVWKSGNMGRKFDANSIHGLAYLLKNKTILELFQYLQERGERKWELLKKYPWLRPFAWLRQVFSYICSHFFRTGYSAAKDLKDGQEIHRVRKLLHLDN